MDMVAVGLFAASVLAGAQNALAGGGSFITFSALLLVGIEPRAANVTSTLALFPSQMVSGWAGRGMAAGTPSLSLRALCGISLLGGLLGAVLLLVTPTGVFARLVPWLVLFATAVFAWGSYLRRPPAPGAVHPHRPVFSGLIQLLIAIYGGYFGGGMGFIMIAAMTGAGIAVRAAGATKNVLAAIINLGAILVFAFSPDVRWGPAIIVCVGSIGGGLFGTWALRRLPETALKAGIVAVGAFLTIGLFLRAG